MNETIKIADGQEGKEQGEKVVEIATTTIETKKFAELDAEKCAEIADIQKRIDGLIQLRDQKQAEWDAQKATLIAK